MNELQVGDVVVPLSGRRVLACGSGVYSHAIVVSMEPFILVSEETDMLWSTMHKGDYQSMGKADKEILDRCFARLYKDYPNHKLHTFMDTEIDET